MVALACVVHNLRDAYRSTPDAIDEATEQDQQTVMFIAVDAVLPDPVEGTAASGRAGRVPTPDLSP